MGGRRKRGGGWAHTPARSAPKAPPKPLPIMQRRAPPPRGGRALVAPRLCPTRALGPPPAAAPPLARGPPRPLLFFFVYYYYYYFLGPVLRKMGGQNK